MEISGVHHVSINVDDVDVAKDFYVDVLGMTVDPRPDLGFPGYWLAFADGRQVHLIGKGEVPPAYGQHFAVTVPDLEAAVAEVRAKGIKVSDPKFQPTGAAQSFCSDPSGNLVEFHQPG